MKASYYNFFYKHNKFEKIIAYNARTNALALIEKENYKKYLDFIENSIEITDLTLLNDLKHGDFIIEDNT